ncbi:MAG: WecB/TagA/CpsF family glycosyltransferase [Desulfobacterales bacterium]|nr:WecB/TagA/CpsF family glycosyltransferase [Desulfobacterales bacterium]
MKTKAIGSPGGLTHRCVVLGQNFAIRELLHVLGFTFTSIDVVEAVGDIDHLPEAVRPDVLLVTDSIAGGLSRLKLETAKAKLMPRAIICLTNGVDAQTEVTLRAVGLSFLGTAETFFSHADSVLKCSVRRRTGSPTPPCDAQNAPTDARSHLAQSVQGRLHKSTRSFQRMGFRLIPQTVAVLAVVLMRLIELAVGLVVSALVLLPVYLVLLVRYLVAGIPVFFPRTIVGHGNPVTIRAFNRCGPLQNLPLFAELITGRLALVGTAIADWDARPVTPMQGYIRRIKPGIFSLWQVRRASRIAHEGREIVEWEYVFKKGLVYDLLLLLRGIPGLVYGAGGQSPSPVLRLLDLDIANLTMADAIQRIKQAACGDRPCSVFFVNPDCLNKMATDRDYFHILQQADYVLPDGIGLTLAGKLLQTPLKENINGTDMMPFLCKMAASRGYSLFMLGGRSGVAAQAARRLSERYQVSIAGTAHGYFDRFKESQQVIDQINRSGADILLVGLGAPEQEKWIMRHRHRLAPRVLMGVGGLFDFYSGNIKRAPVWMREIGLEWVYRILQEPGRMWRRYVLGNPLFLYRVARWRFFPIRNQHE